MTNLKYLTLDLFAFNLVDALGLDKEKAQKKCDDFWQNNLLQYIENLPEYQLKTEPDKVKFSFKLDSDRIEGFYQRKKIEDGYNWLFDYSIIDQEISLDQTTNLAKIKQLIPNLPNPSQEKILPEYILLGQTWMISSWLYAHPLEQYNPLPHISGDIDRQLQQFASKLYQDLCGKAWQHYHVGKFLGGTIFEVWCSGQKWDKIEDNSHAIIIFYNDKASFDQAGKFYDHWRHLLYCRHKILFAYQQSRNLKQSLKDYFSEVVVKLKSIRDNLEINCEEDWQIALKSCAKYAIDLNVLISQAKTIEVNLENYNRLLQVLETEGNKFAPTNLQHFQQEFNEVVINQYQKQIEKDYASFTPGLEILKNLVDTIRGMVEVEKIKSDRRIERTIAIGGIAIGTASVSASAISPFIETITQLPLKTVTTIQLPSKKVETKEVLIPHNAWFNFGIAFLISIFIGLLFGSITGVILKLRD